MMLPRSSEPDVCYTDRTPGEQGSKTGQRKQPFENDWATCCSIDKADGTTGQDEHGGEQRAARLIDVGEALWSVTLFGQSAEGTRAAVNTRVADGDD